MTIIQLKEEAIHLSLKEQKELAAFLVHNQQVQNPDYIEEITRQIDDNTEENWVNYKDIRSELLE